MTTTRHGQAYSSKLYLRHALPCLSIVPYTRHKKAGSPENAESSICFPWPKSSLKKQEKRRATKQNGWKTDGVAAMRTHFLSLSSGLRACMLDLSYCLYERKTSLSCTMWQLTNWSGVGSTLLYTLSNLKHRLFMQWMEYLDVTYIIFRCKSIYIYVEKQNELWWKCCRNWWNKTRIECDG